MRRGALAENFVKFAYLCQRPKFPSLSCHTLPVDKIKYEDVPTLFYEKFQLFKSHHYN